MEKDKTIIIIVIFITGLHKKLSGDRSVCCGALLHLKNKFLMR
jgi:hypothetical protein